MKAFAAAAIIALVACLLIGIQRYQVIALRADVKLESQSKDDAIEANKVSQATITTLQAEAKRNADYAADLAQRIKASEAKAKKAEKNFEQLKRTSPPVRDWAAQPLPDGLRGKPSGNKDIRHKN
jgi:LysB family phage lysis regulatory protein